jgi:PAS domain S-box-containing protein
MFYVFKLDNKSRAGRCTIFLFAILALLSACMVIIQNKDTPREIAEIAYTVYTCSFIVFAAALLWFFLAFAEKNNFFDSPVFFTATASFCAFLIVLELKGMLLKPVTPFFSGWLAMCNDGILPVVYYAYVISNAVAGFLILLSSVRHTASPLVRRQKTIISVTYVITLIISLFIVIILPIIQSRLVFISDLVNIVILIWAAGIVYSINNLELFKLTPSLAAESIIASMNELMVLVDEKVMISMVNGPLLKALGYENEILTGRNMQEIVYKDSDFFDVIKDLTVKGECRMNDFSFKKKNGEKLPVILSASFVREKGELLGIVCVASDITDIKSTQDALQNNYKKLIELDSLKSDFTSMMSHELRTPLTSIKGSVSLLSSGMCGDVPAKQMEILAIINRNSDRLLKLINDFLDVSKMESGTFSIHKEPFDLIASIDSLIIDLSSLSRTKNISIIRKSSFNKFMINGDSYRMSQSVINILNNAIKFSPRDSKITVRVEKRAFGDINFPPGISPVSKDQVNFAVIYIEDEGPGIDKNDLGKIFSRFYQVDSAATRLVHGTGLGLSIAKSIAEMHGGAVWAESEGAGKGSTFVMIVREN